MVKFKIGRASSKANNEHPSTMASMLDDTSVSRDINSPLHVSQSKPSTVNQIQANNKVRA